MGDDAFRSNRLDSVYLHKWQRLFPAPMDEPKAANVGGGGGASNLFRGRLIQFASRLFSVLCQQECSPKSDYLLANKDQVKSKKGTFELQIQSEAELRFGVISVGISSSEIRPYRSRRIFWSSVKMEFRSKLSYESETNCLILPLWC